MLADCHAHFSGLNAAEIRKAVQQSKQAGIEIIIAVGMDLESSAEAVKIAETYDIVYAAVGIHPWNAVTTDADFYQKLKSLASRKKVVAICEIGLDFTGDLGHPEQNPPDSTAKELQQRVFTEQLQLARELGKPAMIHYRGAFPEVIDILKKERGVQTVLHNFVGDENMLQEAMHLGCYFSEGRAILAPQIVPDRGAFNKMVKKIPFDKLLLETDMAPAYPQLGIFMPWYVKQVAEQMAKLRGMTTEEISTVTTTNLKRLLAMDLNP